MPDDRDLFYASAPMRALYAREMAALASIVAASTAIRLFLRPPRQRRIAAHLLGNMIELAPIWALQGVAVPNVPFASESSSCGGATCARTD